MAVIRRRQSRRRKSDSNEMAEEPCLSKRRISLALRCLEIGKDMNLLAEDLCQVTLADFEI